VTRKTAPPETLSTKIAWSATAGASVFLGRVLAAVATARILGPVGAGQLAFLLWLSDTVATVTGLGLQTSTTRFVAFLSGRGKTGEAVAVARWLYRLSCLTLLPGLAIFALTGRARTELLLLAAYFTLQNLGGCYLARLSGEQRFRRIAKIVIASNVVLILLVLPATAVYGVTGAQLTYIASAAIPGALAVASALAGRAIAPPKAVRRECIRYALQSWFAAAMSSLVWSRTEIFLLTVLRSPEQAGYFAVALTLAAVVQQVSSFLTSALMPHLAEMAGRSTAADLERLYGTATRRLALLLLPACFGLAALTPVLVPALFGAAFMPSIGAAAILTAFAALAIANVGSALIYSTGRTGFVALGSLAGGVMSLSFLLVCIPAWGIIGAAWARSAVQFSMVALTAWYIAKRLRIRVPAGMVARIAAAAALAAAPTAVLALTNTPWSGITCGIAGSVLLYFLLIRGFGCIDPSDTEFLLSRLGRQPAVLVSQ
jgi:O-antigen/teichoic acid export membrane protein